ncbi:MAG: hypothetical protein WCJ30_25050, partial [Deltaproteobacteria bacterium]
MIATCLRFDHLLADHAGRQSQNHHDTEERREHRHRAADEGESVGLHDVSERVDATKDRECHEARPDRTRRDPCGFFAGQYEFHFDRGVHVGFTHPSELISARDDSGRRRDVSTRPGTCRID